MKIVHPRSAVLLTAMLVGAVGFVAPALAFDPPPNDGFVTDTTGKITRAEDQALEQQLQAYKDETSNEIAVLMVPSLNGEAPADVAVEVGRKWGVGSTKNNGILMLIAYDTRDIFIATGYGLEGAVPDAVAYGIIQTDMVPRFREGNYYEGIVAGIDALEKHIGGEYTADRYSQSNSDTGGGLLLFLLFVVFNFGGAWLARSKSWWLGGVVGGILGFVLAMLYAWWVSIPILIVIGLIFDYLVSKHPPRGGGRGGRWGGGGWGGGGGGGGGFGGFGGGSFGGGGAGGKW